MFDLRGANNIVLSSTVNMTRKGNFSAQTVKYLLENDVKDQRHRYSTYRHGASNIRHNTQRDGIIRHLFDVDK